MQIVYVIVVFFIYAIFIRWISKYLFRREQIVKRVTAYALDAFEEAKKKNPSRSAEYDKKAKVLREWANNIKS